jgi:hypothetical protein
MPTTPTPPLASAHLRRAAKAHSLSPQPPDSPEAVLTQSKPTTPSSVADYSPALQQPPSCPPALLVEDAAAVAYRTTHYAEFHRRLCEQLEKVLLSQRRQQQRSAAKLCLDVKSPDRQPVPSESAVYTCAPSLKRRRGSSTSPPASPNRQNVAELKLCPEHPPSSKRARMHAAKSRERATTHKSLRSKDKNHHSLVTAGQDDFSWWKPLTRSLSVSR